MQQNGALPPPMSQEQEVERPGSDEAVRAGCKCPVTDNAAGEGILILGETHYVVNEDCPLHGSNFAHHESD